MGRDWVSENSATASPGFTSHSVKTRAKASIHLPSMRSCIMALPLIAELLIARLDFHEKSYYEFSCIERGAMPSPARPRPVPSRHEPPDAPVPPAGGASGF